MAAGTFTFYNEGKEEIIKNGWERAHRAILLTAAYTPAATHTTLSDISANECADGDYAAQNLTGVLATNTAGTVSIDADNVSFGATVNITAKYIAIVVGTVAGSAGTDRLIGYCDLNDGGGALTSVNGSFDVNWHANGLATLT